MDINKFQAEAYRGKFEEKFVHGYSCLVADIKQLKKCTINAFSGEEGELLARIFCNIASDDIDGIKEFYEKYGYIYAIDPDIAQEVIIRRRSIIEQQQYFNQLLTLSAKTENPRTDEEYKDMVCAMLYFLLFNEYSVERTKTFSTRHESSVWILQKRFAEILSQEETIDRAICELLKEYEKIRKGFVAESSRSLIGKSIVDWPGFAHTLFCEEICEFFRCMYRNVSPEKVGATEVMTYNNDYGKVTLSIWSTEFDWGKVEKLAKKVLCEVLNRGMDQIRWETKLQENGKYETKAFLPNLSSLMIAEITQKVINKASVQPIECQRPGCNRVFSRYTRTNKKYCSIQCKNCVASQAFRKRNKTYKN